MNNEHQQRAAAASAPTSPPYIEQAPTAYEQLRDMLHAAAAQFAYYARNHHEKGRSMPFGTQRDEAEQKAAVNESWVERIKAVLGDVPATNPHDPTPQEMWITIGTLARRLADAEASEVDKKQAIEGHARNIVALQKELDAHASEVRMLREKLGSIQAMAQSARLA